MQNHLLETENGDSSPRLKLKIFGGPAAGEVYFYKNEGQEIVIGRTPDCDIRINDKLLSKNQAMVSFQQNLSASEDEGAWVLSDGFMGKPSTNGTWLYLNEDF
mgnify:CR=1 FL=1